jgi:hypothetical protein
MRGYRRADSSMPLRVCHGIGGVAQSQIVTPPRKIGPVDRHARTHTPIDALGKAVGASPCNPITHVLSLRGSPLTHVSVLTFVLPTGGKLP